MYVGQKFYRFKFSLSTSEYHVVKHTFEIINAKETLYLGGVITEYKPKCIENPKIKYKDGHYRKSEAFDFNKVESSRDAIYVSLIKDDVNEAKRLVKQYLNDRVKACYEELAKLEIEVSRIESVELKPAY